MDLLLKVLFIASLVVTLWSSPRYRAMSGDLDRAALAAMKRMMGAAEDAGYPRQIVPLLILLTLLSFWLSAVVIEVYGR